MAVRVFSTRMSSCGLGGMLRSAIRRCGGSSDAQARGISWTGIKIEFTKRLRLSVARVAALVLNANPTLTPAQVEYILTAIANPNGIIA